MPDDLDVTPHFTIPGGEIHETASRSRGPGGQHVNKTNTRVTLRWNMAESDVTSGTQRARLRGRLASRLTRRGAIVVHADATRSRTQNRKLARARLASLVRDALATQRPRRPTHPGARARARRVHDKRRRGQVKGTRGRVADDE